MEKATELIIEKITQNFERDGLPRIAGRILGYLLVSPDACSLDELAEKLLASKASVSTNARMLERQGVLERVTHPGDRRDYYAIAKDLPERIQEKALDRLRRTRDVLEVALLAPPAADPVVRERLESFATFFGDLLELYAAAEERWRERNHGNDPVRLVAGSRG